MKRTTPSESDPNPTRQPADGALIIVNPKAGAGRALRAAETLSLRLQESSYPAALVRTERPRHATEVAREARRAGVRTVVAVGGDGTIQEVVTGLCLNADGSIPDALMPAPSLALLPAGTGGDYRRTFGFSGSVDQALARILSPQPLPVDIGRAEVTCPDGSLAVLAFANVLSFGIGGLTDRLVQASPKWIGGTLAFYLGAVRATLVYEPLPIELWVDGQSQGVFPFSNVAICLGRYFGGGMKIAPGADPSDGVFEIVAIQGSRASVLALTADIYRGTHQGRPIVRLLRGTSISARATRPGSVLVDADGEQPGALPLAISLMPQALSLLT